jgi:hypothetical protein
LGDADGMTRVTLGKSRVRESRTPGSVRAKAEWLSYSTTTIDEFGRTPLVLVVAGGAETFG